MRPRILSLKSSLKMNPWTASKNSLSNILQAFTKDTLSRSQGGPSSYRVSQPLRSSQLSPVSLSIAQSHWSLSAPRALGGSDYSRSRKETLEQTTTSRSGRLLRTASSCSRWRITLNPKLTIGMKLQTTFKEKRLRNVDIDSCKKTNQSALGVSKRTSSSWFWSRIIMD